MSVLETQSFQLGSYIQGEPNAEKLALVLPGLLDTKDYPHVRSHVDLLANLGFYAISFDMPGTWESGDDINQYTMTNSLKAIAEVVEQFNKPTLLVGHSNGGRLALLASTQNPQVNGCVAIMCAPTFVRASNYEERKVTWKAKGTNVSHRDLPDDPKQNRRFELPYAFCEDADTYDTRDRLGTLTIPKLFIAGKNDPIVRPADVLLSYAAAVEPKEYIEIESDHDYRRNPQVIETVNTLLKNFIETAAL